MCKEGVISFRHVKVFVCSSYYTMKRLMLAGTFALAPPPCGLVLMLLGTSKCWTATVAGLHPLRANLRAR